MNLLIVVYVLYNKLIYPFITIFSLFNNTIWRERKTSKSLSSVKGDNGVDAGHGPNGSTIRPDPLGYSRTSDC